MAVRPIGTFEWFSLIRGRPDPRWCVIWHCIQCMACTRNMRIVVPLPATPDSKNEQKPIKIFNWILNATKITRATEYLHVSGGPNRIYCRPVALGIHRDPLPVEFASGIYWFRRNWHDQSTSKPTGILHPIAYTAHALHWTPLGRPYPKLFLCVKTKTKIQKQKLITIDTCNSNRFFVWNLNCHGAMQAQHAHTRIKHIDKN